MGRAQVRPELSHLFTYGGTVFVVVSSLDSRSPAVHLPMNFNLNFSECMHAQVEVSEGDGMRHLLLKFKFSEAWTGTDPHNDARKERK